MCYYCIWYIWKQCFFKFVFITEEILESIRAKKGEIDIVKSPEEIEKDNNETENNSKDAEKNREEFEDQSLEKDNDDKAPDDDPEQGKSEGKKITWLKKYFISVVYEICSFICKIKRNHFYTNNYLILYF